MKSPFQNLLALLAIVSLATTALAEDSNTPEYFWYSFKIEGHNPIVCKVPERPEELALTLGDKGFVCLFSVREFDGVGHWVPAAPPLSDTLFVRTDDVKSFVPMSGPPKDAQITDKR